jgi:hypothetical protein
MVGADVIGMMNHLRGQPQNPLLNGFKRSESLPSHFGLWH